MVDPSQMSVAEADPDLLERLASSALNPRGWITGDDTGSWTTEEIGKIDMAVELIAITDVYPLKHLIHGTSITVDTEYLELVKLKMKFFDKIVSWGKSSMMTGK
jgi:hypothetical protein